MASPSATVAQVLINDGEDSRADCIVRLGRARRGGLNSAGLPAALEVSDQLAFDPSFCRGADAKEVANVEYRVGDLASVHMAEGCKQCQTNRRRMAAQLVQFLGRSAPPIGQQNLGREVSEQVRWQCKRTDTGELVRFLADALQAGVAGASAQCEQWSTIILAACRIGMGRLEAGRRPRRRRDGVDQQRRRTFALCR